VAGARRRQDAAALARTQQGDRAGRKTFVPRILPVTVGTKVEFRNQDEIFHNVFSHSKPNDFDAGLFKGGQAYSKVFTKPGPAQILCNIHASMLAYVVVLDTPYYGQSDESGEFTIRGVPPGQYQLFTWHERSTEATKTAITIGGDARRLTLNVNTSKGAPRVVPDKYGKPRQVQLGY
jgi:plastocyanin